MDEQNSPTDEPHEAGNGAAPELSAPHDHAGLAASTSQADGDPSTAAQAAERPSAAEPPVVDGSAAGDSATGDSADDEEAAPAAPVDFSAYRPEPTGERYWYILKVQSNREDSIRDALERRIKIAGLHEFFGEIIVPIEMVSEFKGGKKRVVKRKLYPGYIVVNMELNDDTWFLVRETPGIGDFTGAGGKPSPMLQHEVDRIITKTEEKTDEEPKLRINFKPSDRVKITEGTFENFEGDVDSIDQTNGRVTVMINIFGRSTPVELEYWQIAAI